MSTFKSNRVRGRIVVSHFSALVSLSLFAAPALAQLTQFPIPTPNSQPHAITTGPDGNLWFAEFNGGRIGRITTTGTITTFVVPTGGSTPAGICSGSDGRLWFTEFNAPAKIGAITTAGVITEYASASVDGPADIAPGPDGNLWFTNENFSTGPGGAIGRITTAGVITTFPLAAGINPRSIVAGSDGNLWFTEVLSTNNNGAIGRITTAGIITEFAIPTPSAAPYGIALGPDGNVWFTEGLSKKIGRITSSGVITEFPVTPITPTSITTGPDGHLWFTDQINDAVHRMNLSGDVSLPIAVGSAPRGITAGPDGNIWFVEEAGNNVGRILLRCGDGTVDDLEGCDDGDVIAGDGCNDFCEVETCFACTGEPSVCTLEDGLPCNDSDPCTDSDTCTDGICGGAPVVTCTSGDGCCPPDCGLVSDSECPICGSAPEPDAACRLADPSGAGKSSIQIIDDADNLRDAFAWKWSKGAATELADFKVPTTGSADYALCVYDASAAPQPLMTSTVQGGGVVPLCYGNKPCWKETGTKGFSFSDKPGSQDGITSIRFGAGIAGKARVQVKGKGALLLPPPTAALTDVVVQLVIDDGTSASCFKTSFPAAGTTVQTSTKFKSKGP